MVLKTKRYKIKNDDKLQLSERRILEKRRAEKEMFYRSIYNSKVVTKLINSLMKDGKRDCTIYSL